MTIQPLQRWSALMLSVAISALAAHAANPLGTTFIYQGHLTEAGNPANASYDLQFTLFEAGTSGVPLRPPLTKEDLLLTNGLFTVDLDFGPDVFTGDLLWLEIGVRPGTDTGAFTPLTPRQPLSATPNALYAPIAGSANAVAAANITGILALGQLPGVLVTNNAIGVTLTGTFIGSGAGLNNLPWANLTGVPVGFADGIDNDTQYFAGPGLSLAGTVFSIPAGGVNSPMLANLAVTTAALASDAVTMDKIGSMAVGSEEVADGSIAAVDLNLPTFGTTFWKADGNAGTTPGTHFFGTTDNQPLEIKVHGLRALRLEPTSQDSTHDGIVNVVGGSPVNSVDPGVYGATIAGGGAALYKGFSASNAVGADFGTIGGGYLNAIQSNAWCSTIGGGCRNTIQSNAWCSTIGGGFENTIHSNVFNSTVGGGTENEIQTNSHASTIGGGILNTIQTNAECSTIGGGAVNTIQSNANYATIPGGLRARASYGQMAYASGSFSTTPGDAQTGQRVLRRQTSDATPTELLLDGDGGNHRIVIPPGSTWIFDILVAARTVDAGGGISPRQSAGWYIRGIISNFDGVTTMPGPILFDPIHSPSLTWTVAVDPLSTGGDGALLVRVQGESGTTIRWVATVRTTEVMFPAP
jgi:hypothetical protein